MKKIERLTWKFMDAQLTCGVCKKESAEFTREFATVKGAIVRIPMCGVCACKTEKEIQSALK